MFGFRLLGGKAFLQRSQAELLEELCYMRAEVAYLKELKALSQKQTEKDKAKPSKH